RNPVLLPEGARRRYEGISCEAHSSNRKEIGMGKIAVHEFITLDGVFETPTWTMDYPFDPKMGEAIGGIMRSSKALLLGRRTFEMFAPAWSARTVHEDPGAPFMNQSPKYVVSSSPPSVDWNNSTILGSYDPHTIRDLKDRTGGNLYVSGSGTLVRAMLADGLIDELHLFVFPLALGAGERLFAHGGQTAKFKLARTDAYESGVVHLAYHSVE
ncbi:MAG: dihydrofolate reductase family protein, partial [Trebonia sp.]